MLRDQEACSAISGEFAEAERVAAHRGIEPHWAPSPLPEFEELS
ncbi:hypothetical protein [Streptomyces sp. ISL-36]|nr:hypothetical protein [Streptomyces sp. ISL-36]